MNHNPTSGCEVSDTLVVLIEKPQVSDDPKKAEEFDSKAERTNVISTLLQRPEVIPGLVGGWLPDSCTATHSWTHTAL